jgi:hypothetical protein
MVRIGLVYRSSRESFGTAGKTPPPWSAPSQGGPKILSIDEHTPMVDQV